MSKTVYLAGPITGLTYEGCTDWREYAAKQIEFTVDGVEVPLWGPDDLLVPRFVPTGIKTLNPMRMKEFLKGTGPIPPVSPEYNDRFVVERDLYDVRTSDVILMNLLGAERVSIGTMFELGYATALRKFVVVVMEPSEVPPSAGLKSYALANPHEHLFVHANASVVVAHLDEAIEIVKGL